MKRGSKQPKTPHSGRHQKYRERLAAEAIDAYEKANGLGKYAEASLNTAKRVEFLQEQEFADMSGTLGRRVMDSVYTAPNNEVKFKLELALVYFSRFQREMYDIFNSYIA